LWQYRRRCQRLRTPLAEGAGKSLLSAKKDEASAQAIEHNADLLFGRVVLPGVARRMLRISASDDAGVELDFCLIFAP
jgi:hypothetical protein